MPGSHDLIARGSCVVQLLPQRGVDEEPVPAVHEATQQELGNHIACIASTFIYPYGNGFWTKLL